MLAEAADARLIGRRVGEWPRGPWLADSARELRAGCPGSIANANAARHASAAPTSSAATRRGLGWRLPPGAIATPPGTPRWPGRLIVPSLIPSGIVRVVIRCTGLSILPLIPALRSFGPQRSSVLVRDRPRIPPATGHHAARQSRSRQYDGASIQSRPTGRSGEPGLEDIALSERHIRSRDGTPTRRRRVSDAQGNESQQLEPAIFLSTSLSLTSFLLRSDPPARSTG